MEPPRYLRPSLTGRGLGESLMQGILEDGDTDHRDGADSTDDYAGSDQLHVGFSAIGKKDF